MLLEETNRCANVEPPLQEASSLMVSRGAEMSQIGVKIVGVTKQNHYLEE